MNGFSMALPALLAARVERRLAVASRDAWVERLWAADATLWTGADEGRWLGWLQPGVAPGRLGRLAATCRRLCVAGFTDAVMLGMGGATLGAEALARLLGVAVGGLRMHVLDSTDTAQVLALQARLDLGRTLFVVASKSGTTLESGMLAAYFQQCVAARLGRRERPAASSPLPIRVRPCMRMPCATAMPRSSRATRRWADATRCSRPSGWWRRRCWDMTRPACCGSLNPCGALLAACRRAAQPRAAAGLRAGRGRAGGPRQGHAAGRSRPGRAGRLVGAIAGRVHGQGWQGTDPGGAGIPGPARGIRARPTVRASCAPPGAGRAHGRVGA
ncbi:hypothetical protein WJ972_13590 [Achromobacter insuavis]